MTIASDMTPLILDGFRLQRIMALRFCISSSETNLTKPEIT